MRQSVFAEIASALADSVADHNNGSTFDTAATILTKLRLEKQMRSALALTRPTVDATIQTMGKRNKKNRSKRNRQAKQQPASKRPPNSPPYKKLPNANRETTEHQAKVKSKPLADQDLAPARRKRTSMEVAANTLFAAAMIAGLFFSMYAYFHYRFLMLWSFCVAVVLAFIGICCLWHNAMAKSATITPATAVESPTASETKPEPKPAIVLPPSATPAPALPEVKRGWLIPGSGQSPARHRNLAEPPVPADALFLFLGNTTVWTNAFPHRVIVQQGEDMLAINKHDGAIAVSARFFDKDGKIVCKIVDNEFIVNLNNIFYMDRTDHRLTVFGDDDLPVFDVEYINPSSVRILGDYYLRNGKHIVITPDSQTIQGIHSGSEFGGNAVDFNL